MWSGGAVGARYIAGQFGGLRHPETDRASHALAFGHAIVGPHGGQVEHVARLQHPLFFGLEVAQQLINSVEYRFVTLEDVSTLVPVLAAMCPVPDVVAPGLSDLMVNAVEHGNLGVTYQEKSLLKWEGDWEAEIACRLALPQFSGRVATVKVERNAGAVVFTIADEGSGFDWQRFLTFDPERAFDPNGRGIAMARMMSFATLEYQGRGNVVVASVNI